MKPRTTINFSLCVLVVMTFAQSCSVQNQEKEQSNKLIELKELSGDPIDLGSLKGKTVFINVWATWCGPCIREMPSIQRAKNMFGDRIEVLMASEEEPKRIQEFLKSKPFKLRFVKLENADELNLPVLPATYIINPAGDVAFFDTGARKWDDPENVALINKISQGL